jgi:Rps23 Pro-64 3,4-dihydroxylase Tpa1-like proline 4-hydroxylase
MQNIQLVSQFLTQSELDVCVKKIENGVWKYGHSSNFNNSLATPFFAMDLISDTFFSHILKEKIEKLYGKQLLLNRVYANGQTFGQDGSFHQDSSNPNDITFCLYLSNIPDNILDDVGGYLIIKIPNQMPVCIEPRYNSGVIFPSAYYHKGLAFNRYVQNMRICIAWKFTVI